jgi:glutathione synthase/RimK-type ligase-like ATP-grasp enzyme
VAGVDIVEGKNGRPVIFEVNACPAFTVNPRVSNEVEKLAEYLSKCEKI